MGKRPRRNHSPASKAKVAVAAPKGEKSLIELVQDFGVHPNHLFSQTSRHEPAELGPEAINPPLCYALQSTVSKIRVSINNSLAADAGLIQTLRQILLDPATLPYGM